MGVLLLNSASAAGLAASQELVSSSRPDSSVFLPSPDSLLTLALFDTGARRIPDSLVPREEDEVISEQRSEPFVLRFGLTIAEGADFASLPSLFSKKSFRAQKELVASLICTVVITSRQEARERELRELRATKAKATAIARRSAHAPPRNS